MRYCVKFVLKLYLNYILGFKLHFVNAGVFVDNCTDSHCLPRVAWVIIPAISTSL